MRVKVSVSEPWDIGELIAWSSRPGQLVRLETIDGREVALIKLDEPIVYGGESWSHLIGSPRHLGDRLSTLGPGRKVPIAMTGATLQQANSDLALIGSRGRVGIACIGDIEPA